MKKIISKILLVSDFHQLTVPVGMQKGQRLNFFERIFEGIINIWKRWNVRFAIPSLMGKISRHSANVKMAILNGDIVECEYNERGMTQKTDVRVVNNLRDSLQKIIDVPWYFVVGDHEIGYKLPLSRDPNGGVSTKSISNFQRTLGKLFHGVYGQDFNLLFVSSTLMLSDWRSLGSAEGMELQSLKREQEKFIVRWLMEIEEYKKVFVFMHDPDALKNFRSIINRDYYAKNKNFTVFCGHMHADWTLRAYEALGKISKSPFRIIMPKKIRIWASDNLERLDLFRKYDLQIIPAPGGMMGLGGGFKILNIYDDGSYGIEKYSI